MSSLSKKRRWFRDAAIILTTALVLYTVFDHAVGYFFRYEPISQAEKHPAYVEEPYYSPKFVQERREVLTWTLRARGKLALHTEFHGRYFNIERKGYRQTVNRFGRSDPGVRVVLLIGGSTVQCAEVPDEFTVASQLATSLNADGGTRYHVMNAGMQAADTNWELKRLKMELAGESDPDLVVLLDGINDIYHGIYKNRRAGPVAPRGKVQPGRDAGPGERFLHAVAKLLPTNIYEIRRRNSPSPRPPGHMRDAPRVARIAVRTRSHYERNVLAMDRLARGHDARLFVFLQPSVFTGSFERDLEDVRLALAATSVRMPRLEEAFRVGVPLLREAISDLREQGVNAFDITDALDAKQANVYFDEVLPEVVDSAGGVLT